MSLTKQYLNVAPLVPLAQAQLDSDSATQQAHPGDIGFYHDSYGPRWFVYVKNVSGSAQTIGLMMRRVADTTIASITSGTTTSITKTGAGLTASAHVGKLLFDETEATAGAAPEGESGVITSNTATVVSIDAALPFSAAPSATANVRITSPGWHADLAGATLKAADVLGVIVGTGGISNNNFGWLQYGGYCPLVVPTAAAITQGASVATAASGKISSTGATTDQIIGKALLTVGATNSGFTPVYLHCYLLASMA